MHARDRIIISYRQQGIQHTTKVRDGLYGAGLTVGLGKGKEMGPGNSESIVV